MQRHGGLRETGERANLQLENRFLWGNGKRRGQRVSVKLRFRQGLLCCSLYCSGSVTRPGGSRERLASVLGGLSLSLP